MEEYFASSNYVAYAEDKMIGFICALPSIDRQCYFIWQVVVDQNYHGKKVATILVNRIIEEAKLKGFPSIELSIDRNNEASHSLFKRVALEHNSTLKTFGEYTYNGSRDIVYSIEL